ncbi:MULTISPECIES: hypothetical protein [Cupriavidus]
MGDVGAQAAATLLASGLATAQATHHALMHQKHAYHTKDGKHADGSAHNQDDFPN